MRKLHRYILGLLLILGALLSLSGCGKKAEDIPTLWVVTEESEEDGMNQQIRQVIKDFQQDHPGIEVMLDILPTDSAQRELALKQLRTKIMAGKGPDVFLLPSCNSSRYAPTAWRPSEYLTLPTQVEPLFLDPCGAMHNGVFMDISRFYDSDATLKTEELQHDVMEAGTLEGGRYLVPLRYDFPVLYVDVEGVKALGLEPEMLEGSWENLVKIALSLNSPLFANSAKPDFCKLGGAFTLLPTALNYESGTVNLGREDLVSFLTQYRALEVLSAGRGDEWYGPNIERWVCHDKSDPNSFGPVPKIVEAEIFPRDVPISVGTLSQAPCALAIAQAENRELRMIPLTDSNGKLVADVTYYAALGASCREPELSYDLLRRFLLEENQWEQNRPLMRHKDDRKIQFQYHPIADGWPVRNHGWIEICWGNFRNAFYHMRGALDTNYSRSNRILHTTLTDENFPILDIRIDRVSFGNTIEQKIAALLREIDGGTNANVDLNAQAEQLLREIKWQMMEGWA